MKREAIKIYVKWATQKNVPVLHTSEDRGEAAVTKYTISTQQPPENIYCHLKEGAMYSG